MRHHHDGADADDADEQAIPLLPSLYARAVEHRRRNPRAVTKQRRTVSIRRLAGSATDNQPLRIKPRMVKPFAMDTSQTVAARAAEPDERAHLACIATR